MCSKASAVRADAPAARCLLCNVACPVRATTGGPDVILPDYVPFAGYAGLCARGSVLVELLDHPARLHEAWRQQDGRQQLTIEAAARQIADALSETTSAAVLIDGNWDVETVAAAGRFAAAAKASWAVYVPPSDEGLVRGLDFIGCRFIGPEALAEAQSILIIGNPYATHPVSAHWVFEARRRNPRMPVLVVGDGGGITAEFATDVYQPALRPGAAARAVQAIDTGQTDGLGPDARKLAGWKKQLAGQKPAIVVCADLGLRDALALSAAVANLAGELDAGVCPLTSYGAAWGSVRAAQAGGACSVEELLAQRPAVLTVIGTDLPAAIGDGLADAVLGGLQRLIYVGPMPNGLTRRAWLVVPASFPFEASGHVLAGPGRLLETGPLLPPPAGVPTVRAVLAMAGGPAEAPVDLQTPAASTNEVASPAAAEGGSNGLMAAVAADPFHFADGSLTGLASWPQAVRPRPAVLMAESAAQPLGLSCGSRAVVEGPAGSVEADVITSPAQRPDRVRLSAAFREVRSMCGWKWNGPAPEEPVAVRIRKA